MIRILDTLVQVGIEGVVECLHFTGFEEALDLEEALQVEEELFACVHDGHLRCLCGIIDLNGTNPCK